MGLNNNGRYQYIDIIRCIAISMVIMIHSSGVINKAIFGSFNFYVNIIYSNFIYASVPLFVMISGSLLLNKVDIINDFLKRRLFRVLVPFFCWSLCLFAIYLISGKYSSFDTFWDVLKLFVYSLLTNKIHGVYWYVYMLIGLYLITPILQRFIYVSTDKDLKYCFVLWICFEFLVIFFSKFQLVVDYHFSMDIYVGFFITGYYFFKLRDKLKKNKIVSLIGIFICLILAFVNQVYKTNFPTFIFMPLFIYLFITSFEVINNKIIKKIIYYVSRYSYGIYLSHVLIISLLEKAGFFCYFPISLQPISSLIIVLTFELLLFYYIDKIPYLGKYLGV